jgi:hypothetical protein
MGSDELAMSVFITALILAIASAFGLALSAVAYFGLKQWFRKEQAKMGTRA